ncbi:MAG: glucosamine-6-phosphate deaminase [Kistimonas sp.]|nr:glucosamine-6-phosphate deaminase [Kistimonas sp.]
MRLVPLPDAQAASIWVAHYIAGRIQRFQPTKDRPFVLGLPTGGTPVPVYAELVRLYREGKLSFAHVVSFNMDEYIGLPTGHPQSYRTFMHEHLFDQVDMLPENINFLDSNTEDPQQECARYEQAMSDVGGVELFFGGVGRDGHIAFNEPGSSLSSRTRIKTLTPGTIQANARFFDQEEELVPVRALTVGVGTILDAREVVILATGSQKSLAVERLVEGAVSHMWPLSALQLHPKTLVVCDEDATMDLKVRTLRYFQKIEEES